MKKITFILIALISGSAFAQSSANAAANTAAEIVEPLTITKSKDLNFGRIVGSTSGGVVTIANTSVGARTATSTTLLAPGGTSSSAQFDVTASGYTYTITMTDTDLTHTDGTTVMGLAPDNSIGGSSSGDQTIYVGGDLSVGTNQKPGTYTGTVTLTVQYN